MSQKFALHKIAILGTPRSGKTTLMVRLSKGLVDPAIQSTRGLDFHLVNVIKDNIKLQICLIILFFCDRWKFKIIINIFRYLMIKIFYLIIWNIIDRIFKLNFSF